MPARAPNSALSALSRHDSPRCRPGAGWTGDGPRNGPHKGPLQVAAWSRACRAAGHGPSPAARSRHPVHGPTPLQELPSPAPPRWAPTWGSSTSSTATPCGSPRPPAETSARYGCSVSTPPRWPTTVDPQIATPARRPTSWPASRRREAPSPSDPTPGSRTETATTGCCATSTLRLASTRTTPPARTPPGRTLGNVDATERLLALGAAELCRNDPALQRGEEYAAAFTAAQNRGAGRWTACASWPGPGGADLDRGSSTRQRRKSGLPK